MSPVEKVRACLEAIDAAWEAIDGLGDELDGDNSRVGQARKRALEELQSNLLRAQGDGESLVKLLELAKGGGQ